MILCGYSAYPRTIDFAKFVRSPTRSGADLSPTSRTSPGSWRRECTLAVPHAHVVSTTTHKTLRGPRGGLILTNDEELSKAINRSVFPGSQGGPLMHIIAAKAAAFGEDLKPEFKGYAQQIVAMPSRSPMR
jgi:glycine hydroxymethyltransferase